MAWESMFNDYLKRRAERTGEPYVAFDPDRDYLEWVDGKPRPVGIQSFLGSRGIELPLGVDTDEPDVETVWGLGNRKNADFQEVLRREGPDVFESSVALIKEMKARGLPVGVASSSRNCQLILQLAGIEDLFDTRVDGVVSKELGLKGKPNADIFTTAAEQIGVLPGDCVVVEDALSGVEAGANGNFGLVLGVARNVAGDKLLQHGADIVIADLGEITIEAMEAWFDEGIEHDGWVLEYDSFDPAAEKLRETLTSVGNGYLGVRGAYEGSHYQDDVSYPGTYMAGLFNKLDTPIGGRPITNNDFVNTPNWLPIELALGRRDFDNPLAMELLDYRHRLDMRRGVMERFLVCKDHLGHISRIRTRRLASMADPRLCALRWELTPLNWSGPVTVRSMLDGGVINDGVPRYRALEQQHLAPVGRGDDDGALWLQAQTVTSGYQIVQRARTSVSRHGKPLDVARTVEQDDVRVAERLSFEVEENRTYAVEKVVAIHNSLHGVEGDLTAAATETLAGAGDFAELLAAHEAAWEALWDKADIRIDGDRLVQKIARVHAYHMLCTASPHNVALDAGMPARGLNGEAYRGHIFWDEVYIQPFFSQHLPEVARSLLEYRYRRLPAARAYARESDYDGSMFPWQTADDGGEETQIVHYNPKSGKWGPDLSRRQRHVSIAIFFNAWKYVHDTDDTEFLHASGAELMLDIARFWVSIAEVGEDGRYHIAGVMGPDEFHEKLPSSEEHGIRDNAYTNVMVSWLLEKAVDLVDELPGEVLEGLEAKLGFERSDIDEWKAVRDGVQVIVNDDGVLEQFDGYFGLDELDWDAYREKYGDIHRLDRILKAEGDSPDHYKLAKQADALMGFYVLGPDEVCRVLRRLGHDVADPKPFLRANYEYYEPRTSHGSTLSKVVHAVISSYIDAGETAFEWFMEAMLSDVQDSQGGTTPEGIHCGVMAGSLDVIYRYFAGVDLAGDEPRINPHVPSHWSGLAYRLVHKGVWYDLTFSGDELTVKAQGAGELAVWLRDERVLLEAGVDKTLAI